MTFSRFDDMKVDFHFHSTASDGTESPSSLAHRVGDFTAAALTDHDNCNGAGDFLAQRCEVSCGLVSGIELSIEPGAGFDKFHLLGLGINPDDAGLQAFLRRVLEGRNERNRRIIGNFRALGMEVDENALASYRNGEVLARPHFARWLIDHGYAADVKSAFEKYLMPDSPGATRCYEERFHPSQEEAFAVIHAAGGVCVMAHPKYWKDGWKKTGCDFFAARRALAELKEKGLDGLEALYAANTQQENVEFMRIAAELDLLKSAGSDFHGSNKPAVSLGMEVSEAVVGPLLERLGIVYSV